MGLMESMMGGWMGRMSKEDKAEMMNHMMDSFFADMTPEDKRQMMADMVPRMMQGIGFREMMSQMMMGMMGGAMGRMGAPGAGSAGADMPDAGGMMTRMMPQCVRMMLPRLPREERTRFVLEMVSALLEEGRAGLSAEEAEEFDTKVNAAAQGSPPR